MSGWGSDFKFPNFKNPRGKNIPSPVYIAALGLIALADCAFFAPLLYAGNLVEMDADGPDVTRQAAARLFFDGVPKPTLAFYAHGVCS